MRRIWASVALTVALAACGQAPGGGLTVRGSVRAAGLEVQLLDARLVDAAQPWRQPPLGEHCAVYIVRVRALDGRRHELRPDDFTSDGQPAGNGVGRCNTPEMEPVWIDGRSAEYTLTVLESQGGPPPLIWEPR